jgi:3-oxoadipate enol-lactonase
VPEKYVHVDGIATFVRHVGPTTLPEKPPDLSRGETVVCLHCAPGNSALFAELLERLGAAHSPLAFDRPGHARSGSLDALDSVARSAAHLRALASVLGIERCVLVGESQGGMIALEAALAVPELVRGLVLISTAARGDVPDSQLEQLRLVTEGKARREFDRALYSPAASPDVMRRGFMEDLKTDPRVVYQNALALRGFDREGDLARLRCPVLVVAGDDDPGARAAAEQLAARIPNARVVAIPKCALRVSLVGAEPLASALLEFLAELPR